MEAILRDLSVLSDLTLVKRTREDSNMAKVGGLYTVEVPGVLIGGESEHENFPVVRMCGVR